MITSEVEEPSFQVGHEQLQFPIGQTLLRLSGGGTGAFKLWFQANYGWSKGKTSGKGNVITYLLAYLIANGLS